jgi:hypothetical protein
LEIQLVAQDVEHDIVLVAAQADHPHRRPIGFLFLCVCGVDENVDVEPFALRLAVGEAEPILPKTGCLVAGGLQQHLKAGRTT